MAKSKFYAVKKGKKTGIFGSWDVCKQHTQKFKGAIFKSFKTLSEAQQFMGHTNGLDPSNTNTIKDKKKVAAVVVNPKAVVTALNVNVKGSASASASASTPSDTNNTKKGIHLSIQMYFDGASKGNPGIAGCGAYIVTTEANNTSSPDKSSSKSIYLRHFCNRCTNNIAEYSGLVEGLKQISLMIGDYCSNETTAKSTKRSVEVQIKGDSNLIIQQMNGNWAVKNIGMKTKYNECKSIINTIQRKIKSLSNNSTFLISFEHVYRNKNSIADKLANEAVGARKSWITNGDDNNNNDDENEREEEDV